MLNFRTVTEFISIVLLAYGAILYVRTWRNIKCKLIPLNVQKLMDYLTFKRISRKIETSFKEFIFIVPVTFLLNFISICFCEVTEIQLLVLLTVAVFWSAQKTLYNLYCMIEKIKKEERKYSIEKRKAALESKAAEFNSN